MVAIPDDWESQFRSSRMGFPAERARCRFHLVCSRRASFLLESEARGDGIDGGELTVSGGRDRLRAGKNFLQTLYEAMKAITVLHV